MEVELELSFLVMKLAVITGPEECREYGEEGTEAEGLDVSGKKYGESDVGVNAGPGKLLGEFCTEVGVCGAIRNQTNPRKICLG